MVIKSRRETDGKKQLTISLAIVTVIFVGVICLLVFMSKNYKESVIQNDTQTDVSEEIPENVIIEIPEQVPQLTFEEVSVMKAGSVLKEELLTPELIESLFYQTEITEEIKARIWNISYKENNNISLSSLRYIRVLHRGFDGNTHIGEMIVNKVISDDILAIMRELYANDYLIEKMLLIDEYGADDEASMRDNNSSAFNYRTIANSNNLSRHSLGMAVDINPRYNPYVVTQSNGQLWISPENGTEYADRSKDFIGKIEAKDLCVQLFAEHGFSWGGYWSTPKDYQHFER